MGNPLIISYMDTKATIFKTKILWPYGFHCQFDVEQKLKFIEYISIGALPVPNRNFGISQFIGKWLINFQSECSNPSCTLYSRISGKSDSH